MFKSDEEVSKMLEHKNNGTRVLGNGKGSNPNSGGNGSGPKERLNTEEKSEIATLATLVGNKYTSELTGEHPSAVSHYKNGINGNGTRNKELMEKNNEKIGEIRQNALSKVEMFMSMLTEEKASKMKGQSIATAAEKVANIFDKLGPKSPVPLGGGVTVIFHAPRVRKSEDYSFIDVEAISST